MEYLERVAFDKGWNKGLKAGRNFETRYVKEVIIHFLRREGFTEAADWIRKNYDRI